MWWKAIRFVQVPMEDTVPKKVPCLAIDDKDIVWTGRGNFLCGWDDVKRKWEYHKLTDTLTTISLDAKNVFWIGANNGKILSYDKDLKIQTPFVIKELKEGDVKINSIYIDAHNEKWICTSNGLYHILDAKNYQPIYLFDKTNVYRLRKSPEGILAATNKGLFKMVNKEWKPIQGYYGKNIGGLDVNVSDEKFLAIWGEKKDEVFWNAQKIGTDSAGRYKFNDALADGNERFWGANLGGIYGFVPDAEWHYFHEANSDLDVSVAHCLGEDENGDIWVGAEEGLYKMAMIVKTVNAVAGAKLTLQDSIRMKLIPNPDANADTDLGKGENHIVLLLDISASMQSSINKMAVAFANILKYLPETDRVSIVTYNGKTEIMASNWAANKKNKTRINDMLSDFTYEGNTNIRAGLKVAMKLAKENKIVGGNNRIILVSDANFEVEKQYDLVNDITIEGIYLSIFCSQKKAQKQHDELSKMAQMGHGNYFNFAVGDDKAIESAFWQEITR